MAKRDRDIQIAKANTRLRYRPEERALAALVGQAREDYKTDRRTAVGQAATAIHSARKARKPLRQIYAEAQSAADTAHQDVEAAFGRLGTGADAYKAVTDREFALAQQRRADSAAAGQRDLRLQENEARLGRMFAVGQAKQQFRSTLSQLRDRASELAGEKSDYTISQLAALDAERAKRNESRRAATLKHQRAQENIKLQADLYSDGKGGKGKGGFEPASRSERRMFKTDYERALDIAKGFARQGAKRSQVAANLRAGIPSDYERDAKGRYVLDANGDKIKIPAISPIDDTLALRAALDVAYNQYVDRPTIKLLRDAGVRLADLPEARTRKRLRIDQRRPVGTGGSNKAPF